MLQSNLAMTRPLIRWLPALTACALFSACGGVSETGFFGTIVDTGGTGGSSQAGATSNGGASPNASSGSPGNVAGASSLGGSSSAGQATDAGGAPTGGVSSAAAGSSGTAGAAAGSSGSGGNAGIAGSSGGATSAGAAGATADLSCSELIKQGTRQLEAARVCNIAVDAVQCTGKVTNRCNCQVPVQRLDSPETKAYLETLKQLDAKNCMTTCTGVCSRMTNAECRPSLSSIGSAASGSCVASNSGPTF